MRSRDVPRIEREKQAKVVSLGRRFYRVIVRHGFMQEPEAPGAVVLLEVRGLPIAVIQTSFFLGRETIIPGPHPGMSRWPEALFSWMSRNAAGAMDFFRIPSNRVVELGAQVEI
jgi:KUP system potassium uptake protein